VLRGGRNWCIKRPSGAFSCPGMNPDRPVTVRRAVRESTDAWIRAADSTDGWNEQKGPTSMIDEGKTAPAFSLNDQFSRKVSLEDFRDRQHVLLVFYPLDWTPT